LSLVAASVLFACTFPPYAPNQPPSIPSSQPSSLQPIPTLPGAPPATPATSVKVALLAPQSGAYSNVGATLVNAAQLALGSPGSPVLDIRDTQSTPAGAAAAATAAIAAGDQLIIGPLSGAETAAVAPIAQKANIPVLAFTNDGTQSTPGVWTLGITADQQFERLVQAAHEYDNRMTLAALLPQGVYGDQVVAALGQAATKAGFPAPNIVRYDQSFSDMNNAVRDLADYADRRGPLDEKIRQARANRTAEGRKEAAQLAEQAIPAPPFDVLAVGATGQDLVEIESLLPYYDLNPSQVRFLGPSNWAYDSGLGLSAISGGWYAAPDPALRAQFVQNYMAKYATTPPTIADVAYDAASLARVLAVGQGLSVANLTSTGGFVGADGVFVLDLDGHVRRALAIFQIEPSGTPQMVQPSPQTLAPPAS